MSFTPGLRSKWVGDRIATKSASCSTSSLNGMTAYRFGVERASAVFFQGRSGRSRSSKRGSTDEGVARRRGTQTRSILKAVHRPRSWPAALRCDVRGLRDRLRELGRGYPTDQARGERLIAELRGPLAEASVERSSPTSSSSTSSSASVICSTRTAVARQRTRPRAVQPPGREGAAALGDALQAVHHGEGDSDDDHYRTS